MNNRTQDEKDRALAQKLSRALFGNEISDDEAKSLLEQENAELDRDEDDGGPPYGSEAREQFELDRLSKDNGYN